MCYAICARPGKFEGEPCIAQLAYKWMMDGMADEWGSIDDGTPTVFRGPFTDAEDYLMDDDTICDECLDDLLTATEIRLFENNDGFVHVSVHSNDRDE